MFFRIFFVLLATLYSQEILIPTKNAELFCRVVGEGKPLLVLHGGPGLSQEYLLPQMERLSENFLVIFYDQRGCGRSTGEISPEGINMQTFVEDIDAIRKELHFEKISLLGHSWGASLAMHYAIAHPEYVEKLILSNTIPASSEEFSLFLKEWVQRTASCREELAALQASPKFLEGDPDTVEHYYRTLFSTYCYLPEKVNLLHLRMPPSSSVSGGKVFELFQKNFLSRPFNLHPDLKKLAVPTLVVHGDADMIPPCAAEAIHRDIPSSQYVLLTECGHFPYVEAPEAFFQEIRNFLD